MSARYQLLFKDVSSFVPVQSKACALPSNIMIADGNNPLESRAHALHILETKPTVNAVVILEPPQRPKLTLQTLYAMAAEKTLRTSFNFTHRNVNPYAKFSDYIASREAGLKQGRVFNRDQVSSVVNFWMSSMDIIPPSAAKILETTMTYVSAYANGVDEGSYVNTHIDHGDMDARLVECVEGSGTILCADDDFEVTPVVEHDTKKFALRQLHAGINCWELMTGSSVMMRGSSERTLAAEGARPCIHAHGIGGRSAPEQRMTLRHDLAYL